MALKMTGEKWAAFAYLAPVTAVAGIWTILLFVGNNSKSGPVDMLQHVLVEAPERALFWWLASLPIACLLLSALYFSNIARGTVGALVLCAVGLVLAVATWLTLDWTLALFVTLPLLFSIPTVKSHLTTSRSGP